MNAYTAPVREREQQMTEPQTTEPQKKKRGGRRAGAGRTSTLGPTTRRDLRVSPEIEKMAVRVGGGSFSDGMRLMCEEYIKLRPRDTLMERPPLDAPVLVYLEDARRWAVAQAYEQDGDILFHELAAPKGAHKAAVWRTLPDAP